MRFRTILLVFPVGVWAVAQTPPHAPADSAVIRLTTQEVVLDLVVRDKHGKLVNDLRPDEVQVFEDGVQQTVGSFRNVQGVEQLQAEKAAARAEAAQPGVAHPLNSLRQVNFVSIVFAPMAQANLKFAKEAVLNFLKSEVLPNTYATIYRLDARLRLVQPYTHDKVALLAAVDRVTNGAFILHAGNTASPLIASPGPGPASPGAATGPAGNPLGGADFDPRDGALSRNLGGGDAALGLNAALQAEAVLENSNRFGASIATGMTILDQLRQLILSQARLTGRKVVLYLSDGLQLPMDRARVFEGIVSDANRAAVTFYTVDTRGLTDSASRPMSASRTQLDRIASSSAQQDALNAGQAGGAGNIQRAFDVASEMDDVQLLAVSNTQLALQELAARTGGFAVANTNEIAKPMEHVMEEIRTHYEIAYSPKSDLYDGHFRTIRVNVDRPKTTVQTRRGYYALPDLNGQPIQPFEMVALQAIGARPPPHAISYQAAVLQFRPAADAVQCEVAFEIPFAGLKIIPDAKTGTGLLKASVVALIRDSHGEIVSKVSRQLFRAVPNAQIKALQNEKIDYAEPVGLAPGSYTLDTAVVDSEGNAAAAQHSAFEIKPAAELALSSVEVVKRVDPLQGSRNPLDPFQMEDRRVTLSLGNDIPSGKAVDLYFVVYPTATAAPAKLLVELMRGGKAIARMSPDLPKPDTTGVIPMVAELKPPAGEYEIRVTVRQGLLAAESRRALTIH